MLQIKSLNVLVLVVCTLTGREESTAREFTGCLEFKPTLDCNSKAACAFDAPSVVGLEVEGSTQCALVCAFSRGCVGFNYFRNDSTCNLFNFVPYKILHAPFCTNYYVPNLSLSSNQSGPLTIPSKGRNIALKQRTGQSSTSSTAQGTVLASWLAVDGLHGTSLGAGDCSHTNDSFGAGNWFVVDLSRPAKISHVRILTRRSSEAYYERYKNLIIGVTNSSCQEKVPVRNEYPLCGIFDRSTDDIGASWIQINCSTNATPPSRYVIVQQSLKALGGFLSLCEVEVYEKL